MKSSHIRNVAIIAHVDHGKTTLVDGLLRQSGVFREGSVMTERVMDSNDQERERGITILSKNASVNYKDYLINIVDTPGHADFGGQVERVLGTVDGALLIVDAWEGPMAQTRFVTKKALEMGLTLAVVINKIDRPGCDPHKALDKVFDLFVDLGASEEQLDFGHIFASGRNGTCRREMADPDSNFMPLFELIVNRIPAPKVGESPIPLLQVTSLDYQEFLGRMAVGRLRQGTPQDQPDRQPCQRGRPDQEGPHHQDPLPRRRQAEGDRRGHRRPDRLPLRHPRLHPRRHHLRRGEPGPPAPHQGGSAHHLHALLRQRLALLRQGRRAATSPPTTWPTAWSAKPSPTWPSRWSSPRTPAPTSSPAAACCTSPCSSRRCAAKATSSPWAAPASSPTRRTGSTFEPIETITIDVPETSLRRGHRRGEHAARAR